MFKRIVALLAVAVMVFSFAGCKAENKFASRFVVGATLPVNQTGDVIAKEVAAKYEMKTITSYADKEYKTFEHNGKNVLVRVENSGNVRILFEYPLDTEIIYNAEATKRGVGHIYFTKCDAGAVYKSLCSVYVGAVAAVQNTVVNTPCSNMVMLDVKPKSDMYSCGVIASDNKIMVIDLAKGSVKTEYTCEEIKLFVDMGDKFFGTTEDGGYVETILETADKDHIMVNIIEKNEKDETVKEINFTFNPSNGVASL